MIEGKDSMSVGKPETQLISGAFLFMGIELQARVHQSENLMKNGSKRRAWTSVQVRELKTLARKKTPAARIATEVEKNRRGYASKGIQPGGVPLLPGPDTSSVQPIEREAPPIVPGLCVNPQSPVFPSYGPLGRQEIRLGSCSRPFGTLADELQLYGWQHWASVAPVKERSFFVVAENAKTRDDLPEAYP